MKLEEIIKKSKVTKRILNELPKKLRISEYALKKAFAIEKLVSDIHGNYEWYGYLIAKKDDLFVVDDIYLPQSQNTGGHTGLDPEEILSVIKSEELENYMVVGWVHSHNTLGIRDFSRTDKDNMETLIETTKHHYSFPIEIKKIIFKNLVVYNEEDLEQIVKNNEKASLIIKTNNKLSKDEIDLYDVIKGTFVYSLLVGRERTSWTYRLYKKVRKKKKKKKNHLKEEEFWNTQAITTLKYSIIKGNIELNTFKTDIEVLPDTRKINMSDLEKEVKEKIKVSRYYYPDYYRAYWVGGYHSHNRKRSIIDERKVDDKILEELVDYAERFYEDYKTMLKDELMEKYDLTRIELSSMETFLRFYARDEIDYAKDYLKFKSRFFLEDVDRVLKEMEPLFKKYLIKRLSNILLERIKNNGGVKYGRKIRQTIKN